jgi:hypothetical protein
LWVLAKNLTGHGCPVGLKLPFSFLCSRVSTPTSGARNSNHLGEIVLRTRLVEHTRCHDYSMKWWGRAWRGGFGGVMEEMQEIDSNMLVMVRFV